MFHVRFLLIRFLFLTTSISVAFKLFFTSCELRRKLNKFEKNLIFNLGLDSVCLKNVSGYAFSRLTAGESTKERKA